MDNATSSTSKNNTDRSRGSLSFRARLILATMLITFLAVAGMGVYVFYRAQQTDIYLTQQLDVSVRQQAEAVLQKTSSEQVGTLNNFFASMRKEITNFGATTGKMLNSETQLGSGNYWDAAGSLSRLPNGSWDNPDTDEVSVFIPAKVELTAPLKSQLNTLAQLNFTAPTMLKANPDTVAIYFGGLQGEVLYYPNVNLAGLVPPEFDGTQRPWYLTATSDQNIDRVAVWSAPYLDAASNGLVITTSVPVYDASTKLRGVTAMDIQLNKITAIVSSIKIGDTGHAFLLGKDNQLIAMPTAAYKDFGITPAAYPLGSLLDKTLLSTKISPDLAKTVSNMNGGKSGQETISINGIEYFVIYTPIPEVGYSLAVVVPSQELLTGVTAAKAQISESTQSSLLLGGLLVAIVLVLAFLAAFAIGNRLVKPLGSLTYVAQEITNGNLNVEATVQGQDEIGLLATTFNSMTAQLRDLIGSLEQRVADRTKALATSTEISRRLSTILDRQELVREVVDQVKNAFGYDHAQIYFFDESRENLVMAGGTGVAGEKMLAQAHKISKGRGLVGRAAETNQAVLVSDTVHDPEWLPNPLLPETKSEIALPIKSGDLVLGVLDVQQNRAGGLQQADVDALQSIANQVAIALQNIRQYEMTQKIAADMGVVANVGIATSTITDAGRLLQEVVDLSKKSFDLYHAHIYLLNEAGDALDLASGAGEVGRQMVAEKRSIPLDRAQSLVARAARFREGVVVNDVTAAPDFLPNPLLPNTRSEMAVPMLVAGKVMGVLDVQADKINRFTDVDVSIQTTLASQVAVALQNARSFAQTQRQAQRETAVNLITQKIQNTTSVEAAMQVAARELGHALGMKSTRVMLEPDVLAGELNRVNQPD